MKNINKFLISLSIIGILIITNDFAIAGNKDRSGQAGAAELLINPWARSSGWGGVNTSCIRGLESMYTNIAGLAFTERTELIFVNTEWLKGADINMFAVGFAQRVGDAGVIGLSVMSMGFGDIEITTVDLPEGGIGTFSPNLMNIGLAYSKAFSSSIYGGLNLKVISESISDASAQGIALDMGIQYVTGDKENIKFGIALKNVGPRMKFSGDGYSLRTVIPGQDNKFTMTQRGADFELPAQLNIGASYDFLFKNESRFTLAGNFISNSFTKDQVTLGGEFSLRNYLMLRAAYTYEKGINEAITDPERSNASKGLSGGFSVQVPMNKEKKGSALSIDYSYRSTEHFEGTHTIGARINF